MKNTKTTMIMACFAIGLICAPADRAVASLDVLAAGNTAFALDLYGKLKTADGNLFFSPYSISTALAMTYAGARGETRTQMAAALHFPATDLDEAFLGLQTRIQEIGAAGNVRLEVANSLWPQKKYTFLPDYLALTKKYYGVTITPVDFPEPGRAIINQWVEDKTQKKITNLIPPGALNDQTRLVLANAIYFKGKWANQFVAEQTKDAPFHVTTNQSVSVPMMTQTKSVKYAEFDLLQTIELPYVGDELSMIIFLPTKKATLAQLENDLTAANLAKWRQALSRREIRVFLPKFKITWQVSLVPAMQAMGMQDAFGDKADFSGMDGRKDLLISGILHKAFVDVNEEGTEAAAATGVAAGCLAMPAPPPVFRADHPFLFVIQENRTGSILFVGRVVNPKEQ